MEAIGQLTGGIAHDFNNLLGVVIGNLQLLERSVSETPTLARKVHTAMRAAVRGADLTRRLLAFARRQILDPVVVDAEPTAVGPHRADAADARRIGRSAHGAGARPVAHARRRGPVRERDPEPRDQRARCDAGRRPPDGAHPQRLSRFDFLQRPPGDRAGRVRRRSASATPASASSPTCSSACSSRSSRPRNPGKRQRPRARDGRTASRSRPAASRRSRARSAEGTTVTILLPRCMEEQTRARGHDRHQDRAGRQRDDPRRRGRCRSARDGRHRAVAARLSRAVRAERQRRAAHSLGQRARRSAVHRRHDAGRHARAPRSRRARASCDRTSKCCSRPAMPTTARWRARPG